MKLLIYALAKPIAGLFASATFVAFDGAMVEGVEVFEAEAGRLGAVEEAHKHLDDAEKKHEHKHKPAPEEAPAEEKKP